MPDQNISPDNWIYDSIQRGLSSARWEIKRAAEGVQHAQDRLDEAVAHHAEMVRDAGEFGIREDEAWGVMPDA